LKEIELYNEKVYLGPTQRLLLKSKDTLTRVVISLCNLQSDDSGNPNIPIESTNPSLEFLKEFTKLRSLSLDFKSTYLPESLTSSILNIMTDCPKIIKFELDLTNCTGLTEGHLFRIFDSLDKFEDLKTFSLKIGSQKASETKTFCDKFFTKLLRSWKAPSSLINFSFDCAYTKEVTDNVIGQLGKMLITCQKMKTLHIGFQSAAKISDRGLDQLTEIIQGKPDLQEISLNFESCQKVNGVGLDNLFQSIMAIPKLECLRLDFDQTGFCNKGLQNVFLTLTKLRELHLTCVACPELTTLSFPAKIDFRYLKNLKVLDLNMQFSGIKTTSEFRLLRKKVESQAIWLEHFNLQV
jgi:hypothetical protein